MRFSCDCLSEKEVGEGAVFVKLASLPGIHGVSLGWVDRNFHFDFPVD